ncbi:MAG TPA: hypothetical protein VF556_15990 [Pyrinomonadaceae bacterium]|jgi:hypothetical protein
MKIKYVLFFLLFAVFSGAGFAQTVKITPKKTVYKRNPREGFEFKKTFTIVSPKISGLAPALNKKIENAVSPERVFDINIKEEINEIYWLDNAEYEVGYNKNGILSIAVTIDGSGAYPSMYTKHVVVDTKTGNRVKAADVFVKIPELVRFADKALQTRIQRSIAELKKDSTEDEASMKEMLAGKKFGAENLEFFSVNDKGVTFYFDYGFPHVAMALEPENNFFFAYSQLKPFIKPNGLLNQFVR